VPPACNRKAGRRKPPLVARLKQHRRAGWLVAAAVYLLLTVIFFYPLLIHLDTRVLSDDVFFAPDEGRSDAYNFLWSYWWIQKATVHLKDPMTCDWVLPPTGADLLFHTHVILPTLLTLPLGLVLGPVAGYNLMVLLSFPLGAFVFFVFLRRTFGIPQFAATAGGALFGFMPYFITKAHAHPNLINGAIWGGCLAVLWYAYVKDRFTWRQAVLFSVLFWGSFWTSFAETFMLAITIILSVIILEIFRYGRTSGLRGRGRFALMLVAGGIIASVPLLLHGVNIDYFATKRWLAPALSELLYPPRLHFLAAASHSAVREYFGFYIPLSVVLAGCFGWGALTWSPRYRLRGPIILTTLSLGVLCFNNAAEDWVARVVPLAAWLRVWAQLLPAIVFFLCVFAAFGIAWLWRQRTVGKAATIILLVLAAFEYYPFLLKPLPVLDPDIPASVLQTMDEDKFVMYLPRRGHRGVRINDTFQVAIDKPVVHLSFLAHESAASAVARRGVYRKTYLPRHVKPDRLWYREAKALNIGYIFAEDTALVAGFNFPHEIMYEGTDGALVRVW
jgi:hypothetical protein